MAQETDTPARVARHRYLTVDLASLRADRLLTFDLYINQEGRTVLYREKSLPFDEGARTRLLESRVKHVYIPESQRTQFLGYMEGELPALLRDAHIPAAAKANMVYVTAKAIAGNIFENPSFGENIKRSEKLVSQTVEFLTDGRDSFHNLVKLSDVDYKLYSHSVNVCTYALGLAQEAGVDDPGELTALGIGAMLHDVGKTKIDPRVLRKRSALSHAEFELMKKHIDYGVEIVKQMPDIPKAAYIPVIQHNEREDGTGYPLGLTGDQIHLFGKITAIADVFDAMTTNRVFQKASTAFEAFSIMLKMPLDQNLLHRFIQLLGPEKVG
jgi:HD-GYP domain-containing protein (c-di-GMP phosphodiesterase class II)